MISTWRCPVVPASSGAASKDVSRRASIEPAEYLLRFTTVGEGGEELVPSLERPRPFGRHEVAQDLPHDRNARGADRLERRLGVLGKSAGHSADVLVATAREQAPLTIAVLPQARQCEGEQRQRPSLLRHVAQHVVHEPLIFEPVTGDKCRLHQCASQRGAGWRRERRQVGENGAQVLEGLALQEEIVSDGEEDVHVGVEHESSQELREAVLHLDPVQREQLLGLIDDKERVIMLLAPSSRQEDGRGDILETGQEVHRLAIAGQLRSQRLGQSGEGPVPRCAHEGRPASRKGRHQSGPQEGALASAGGPDHGSQARVSQLTKQRLHFELAAEEEAGVLSCEMQKTRVRALVGATRLMLLDFQGARERTRGGIAVLR